ncbi:MAG: hypothetical protein JOZ99_06635, partial [Actinobacteria bacterium]|nr:hypothetical protein [Actinomycetota bacterium]
MTDMSAAAPAPGYPVSYDVEPQTSGRNRLTTAFRVILAFPHLVLVGGAGVGLGWQSSSGGVVGA